MLVVPELEKEVKLLWCLRDTRKPENLMLCCWPCDNLKWNLVLADEQSDVKVHHVDMDDIAGIQSPLVNNGVNGVVDYKGRPVLRSKSGCWRSAYFIIGVEVTERFANYGVSSNLITYLTGPLGQSTATAAENVNIWSRTASILPLVGAFIANTFLGRYLMIIIAFLLYILALALLAFSTLFSSDCETVVGVSSCAPPRLQVIFFFISLYLVAFVQGGHKPCVQAFGADRFDADNPKERKAKSSFFNWWYFGLCVGPTVGKVDFRIL